MSERGPKDLGWVEHLQELGGRLRSATGASSTDAARGEVWLILNIAITRYLRQHASRLGSFSREEFEDIAAEKSLHLLERIVSGAWDIANQTAGEIPRMLSTISRNSLVDLLKSARRRAVPIDEEKPGEESILGREIDKPDNLVERKEFAMALRGCVEKLSARSRLAWFFRVFYDMPIKAIAVHPEIRLTPVHVRVVLQRGREALRNCMRVVGYVPQDMPPDVFLELWRAFRLRVPKDPMERS